jgi:hypothetical protein
MASRTIKSTCGIQLHIQHKHLHQQIEYPCKQCTKIFPTTQALNGHQTIHKRQKKDIEPNCDQVAKNDENKQVTLSHTITPASATLAVDNQLFQSQQQDIQRALQTIQQQFTTLHEQFNEAHLETKSKLRQLQQQQTNKEQ